MKVLALVLLSCIFLEGHGYPYPYYPYYGNMDTLSYGASDSSRGGGMVLSRYYSPYYTPRVGGGMAAFMFKQPNYNEQPSQYYMPDKRRQITQDPNFLPPPQENEVYYPVVPVAPEKPATVATEIADPTEKVFQPTEAPTTTVKTVVPELIEPEIEEVEDKRRRVPKRKQVKPPVVNEEDDEDEQPKMPSGAFFPMFFGWGRNGGGAPGGATAIANAYSTGRGGVATSHATAYGMPTPDFRNFKDYKSYQQQLEQN